MAKPKKVVEVAVAGTPIVVVPRVQPITQDFSMGDLNHLRDKVNEIIKVINS